MSFEIKYNIGFGIPIEFPSQRKKIVKLVHKQEIGLLWSRESFEDSAISNFESQFSFDYYFLGGIRGVGDFEGSLTSVSVNQMCEVFA